MEKLRWRIWMERDMKTAVSCVWVAAVLGVLSVAARAQEVNLKPEWRGKKLVHLPAGLESASWLPDGRRIALAYQTETGRDDRFPMIRLCDKGVAVLDIETGKLERIRLLADSARNALVLRGSSAMNPVVFANHLNETVWRLAEEGGSFQVKKLFQTTEMTRRTLGELEKWMPAPGGSHALAVFVVHDLKAGGFRKRQPPQNFLVMPFDSQGKSLFQKKVTDRFALN
jgi:hypothetical protein